MDDETRQNVYIESKNTLNSVTKLQTFTTLNPRMRKQLSQAVKKLREAIQGDAIITVNIADNSERDNRVLEECAENILREAEEALSLPLTRKL